MDAITLTLRRDTPRADLVPTRRAAPADAVANLSPWRDWARPAAVRRWDALSQAASTPNPFFESWYLLPSLEQFDADGGVQILSVERGGELLGLVPLGRAPRYGRWPIPHMSTWLHANCFLGAPLVAAGEEAAFWRALLGWADANAGRALFLHFPAMPLEAALTATLFEVGKAGGRSVQLVHREQRALLCSPLSPANYLQRAVPGKKRKEYRRQQARLSEQGVLAFERRADAQDLDTWIAAFLALELAGWKGNAGSALASAPQTAALFRDALTEAAARGKLERLALMLDGHPVAMLANFLCPPGSFSFKTAFDERFSRFSPGVLLQLENLALLKRPGIDWCDSCASADHPMIDSLWMERRPVGRLSVAIGGSMRRALFSRLLSLELSRNPTGIER